MCKYFFLFLLLVIVGWIGFYRWYDKTVPVNQSTKTCLVTGASSGIGKELARQMVKRDWKVVGIARRAELLDELVKELGDNFIPYVCDVSQPDDIHKVSDTIKDRGLKPTLFFLNAGVGSIEKLYAVSRDKHYETFNTNYFGVVSWVESWLPAVKSYGGGTFVATSSVSSLFASPGSASYSASKAALNNCFESWRLQYLYENIGFALVLPGPVDTEMLKTGKDLPFKQKPEDTAKYIINKVFAEHKCIHPSWVYSIVMKGLKFLPDRLILKLLGTVVSPDTQKKIQG